MLLNLADWQVEISSMQNGGFGLNGAHFPKFGHFSTLGVGLLKSPTESFGKWAPFKPNLPFCILLR